MNVHLHNKTSNIHPHTHDIHLYTKKLTKTESIDYYYNDHEGKIVQIICKTL